jgi:hypothetical protein
MRAHGRHLQRLAAACWPWIALALATTHASAQEGPYSNYLVGERSLGLAGAFVGLADDPSSIFHNPAGTARLPTSAAAGSLWALVRGSREINNGYRTDLGVTDLTYSEPLSLPLFLAGVIKLGPRQADGVRPHAIGIALFTPYSDERRFVAQIDDPGAADRLEVRHSDHARWLGLSYAYRVRPGLSFGVSSFWAARSLRHDEVELRARENLPTGSMVGSARSRSSTLDIDTDHLVLRAGTLLELTHGLRAGVMFQPPGFKLGSSASAEHLDIDVGPDPTDIRIADVGGAGASLPMPWELRIGVTWLRPPDSLITLDLSLFGPTGSPSNPLPLVKDDTAPLGVLVPQKTYRRASLRGAIGFETAIGGLVPLRGGLFFERSSAPPIEPTSDVYALDHIDSVGIAFSLGLRAGRYDLSVGTTAVVGSGQGLALLRSSDLDAAPTYRATRVKDTLLMIYVGGARSALKQVVHTMFED